MTDHKPTSEADIIVTFPDMPSIIQGEPTMRKFLRILQQLMICAQLHEYPMQRIKSPTCVSPCKLVCGTNTRPISRQLRIPRRHV